MSTPARTPLHPWHACHGARFIERDGWQLPGMYSTAEAEAEAAHKHVALADISAFAKVSLRGQGVGAVTSALLGDTAVNRPRGVAALPSGTPALACRLT